MTKIFCLSKITMLHFSLLVLFEQKCHACSFLQELLPKSAAIIRKNIMVNQKSHTNATFRMHQENEIQIKFTPHVQLSFDVSPA